MWYVASDAQSAPSSEPVCRRRAISSPTACSSSSKSIEPRRNASRARAAAAAARRSGPAVPEIGFEVVEQQRNLVGRLTGVVGSDLHRARCFVLEGAASGTPHELAAALVGEERLVSLTEPPRRRALPRARSVRHQAASPCSSIRSRAASSSSMCVAGEGSKEQTRAPLLERDRARPRRVARRPAAAPPRRRPRDRAPRPGRGVAVAVPPPRAAARPLSRGGSLRRGSRRGRAHVCRRPPGARLRGRAARRLGRRPGRAPLGSAPPARGGIRRARPARRGRRARRASRELLVQLRAHGLWQRFVGGVPDQEMTEAKCRLGVDLWSLRPNELLSHEQLQLRRDVLGRGSGGERDNGSAMEHLTFDRAAVDDGSLVLAERVETRLEHRLDRRRDLDRLARVCRASVTSSSRKSGLPSAVARIRDLVSGSSSTPTSRLSASSAAMSAASGSSRTEVAFSLPPPQPGRASRSSGRAMQSRKIGTSRDQSATCSTRSWSGGSAQCRSSSTTTSGRSCASRSKSARVESCVSAGDERIASSGIDAKLDEHLDEREVGDALAVGERATASDRGDAGNVVEEVRDEPRLPDAGRADHREEPARPGGDRVVEVGPQPRSFALAPDHRALELPALRPPASRSRSSSRCAWTTDPTSLSARARGAPSRPRRARAGTWSNRAGSRPRRPPARAGRRR